MQTTRKNQPQNAANQVAFQDVNVQNGVSFQNVSRIFNGVDQDQGKQLKIIDNKTIRRCCQGASNKLVPKVSRQLAGSR